MLNFKRSRVLMIWLLSYLAVVMLPLVVSLASYSIYFENLRKQNENLNQFVVDNTTNHIKDIIMDIRKLYVDITGHKNLLPVLSIQQPAEYPKNMDAYDLMTYFGKTLVYENAYSNYFLYIPETDYVLSAVGAVDSRTYFDAYFGGSETEYLAWKNVIMVPDTGFFFHEMQSKKMGKNYVVYCSTMPKEIRQRSHDAVFCVMVEKERFFQENRDVEWLDSAMIYIFDSQDRLLFGSGNESELPRSLDVLMEGLTSEQAILSKQIAFDTTGLNIVMVTSENTLFAQVASMKNLFLVSTVICILVSFILVLILLKRNYRPISEILRTIGDTGERDEFAEIKQFIRRGILKDRKEQAAMKQMILSHLVKGTYNRHYTKEDLRNYGIVFNKQRYLILCLSVSNPDSYAETSNESLQKRFHELSFMITNVYEELYNNETTTSYVINIDNHFLCVINADLPYENDMQTLLQRAELGASVLNREYELDLTFAFSKPYERVEELAEAYKEALYALNHQTIKNLTIPFDVCAVQGENESAYYYNLEMEQKLIHFIQTKNQEMAETVINDVFGFIENSGTVDPAYTKCLFMDIVFTLIKTSKQVNCDLYYSRIFETEMTTEQMKEWLLTEIRRDCAFAEPEARKDIEEMMLDYIYNNYQNPDLNVNFLSDHFNLSSYYLSKRFKSRYGESLIDFIHQLRLLEAKKLIRHGNKTMAHIAQEVGYTNIRTFNRIFQKYEGATPTQYQKQNQGKN